MPSDEKSGSFADLFEAEASVKHGTRRVRRGERLDAKVVAVTKDAVFVDLGSKVEGFIDRADLGGDPAAQGIQIGSIITSVVSESDGERIRLVPVRVRKEESSEIDAGDEIVRIPKAGSSPMLIEGALVRGTVTGVERYGLFVQIEGTQGRGGRGLVPVQETATPRGTDLYKQFPVGTAVEAKILAIQEDGKIRLSIKAHTEEMERRDYAEYGAREATGEEGAAADGKPSDGKPAAPKGGPRPGPKEKPVRSFGTLGDLLSKSAPKKR